MKNFRLTLIYITLIILTLSLININSLNPPITPSSEITDWFEDGNDLSDWYSATGSPFDSNTINHTWVSIDGEITPDTDWWTENSTATASPKAAIYRELPSRFDELLINSSISFDPTSVNNPYTFAGHMEYYLANSAFELMFRVYIRDGFASSGDHRIFHRVWYYDTEGVGVEIDRSADTNKIIDHGMFSIQFDNNTLSIYSPVTEQWVQLGTTNTILQRGTPKYLLVAATRSYDVPLPTNFKIDHIETVSSFSDVTDTNTDSNTNTSPQNPIVEELAWHEDGNDLSDWSTTSGTGFDEEYNSRTGNTVNHSWQSINGMMTPDASWWTENSTATASPIATMYRELPEVNNLLLINSSITFNSTSISNPYTFSGNMDFFLLNSNFEWVFRIYVRDGFASSGDHRIFHRAWYYDINSDSIEIERSINSDVIVNSGKFAIKMENDTTSIYSPVIDNWVDLGNSNTLFQRGRPKYLVVFAARSYDLPLASEFNIDFIEVYKDKGIIESSATTTQTNPTTSSTSKILSETDVITSTSRALLHGPNNILLISIIFITVGRRRLKYKIIIAE